MRFELHMSAYDVMDQIVFRASVVDTNDPRSTSICPLTEVKGTIAGTGLDNPRTWLRSVLEEAREAL